MIDIEALATPAFLIEVSPRGTDMRLNTAGRAHPALMRGLSGNARTALDEALLDRLARGRVASDVALTAPSPDGTGAWRALIAPSMAPGGRIVALLGLCREVAAADHVRAPDGGHLSLALQAIHGAEWRYDVHDGTTMGRTRSRRCSGSARRGPWAGPNGWGGYTRGIWPPSSTVRPRKGRQTSASTPPLAS